MSHLAQSGMSSILGAMKASTIFLYFGPLRISKKRSDLMVADVHDVFGIAARACGHLTIVINDKPGG